MACVVLQNPGKSSCCTEKNCGQEQDEKDDLSFLF